MNEKRLIVMKRTSLLSLIWISAFCASSLESVRFYVVEDKKEYNEAKTYCREEYTDLATFHNLAEINDVLNSNKNLRAWIGLEIGSDWNWLWAQSDQLSFTNWESGEGQIKTEEACAVMDQNGTWFESDCEMLNSFICQDNASRLFYVNESKPWRDAQSHCWSLSTDLVSIHSKEENRAIRDMSVSNVWIGLFRDDWTWSDGTESSFRFWGSNEPSVENNKECVAAELGDQGKWVVKNCNSENSFICYGLTSNPATTSSQTTQTSTTTDQLSANMTTISQNSSQGFTATSHSAAGATEKLNTSNVTTAAPKTASGNTTESVSHPSSTELHNAASTETTSTPTQGFSNITVSVTTSSASALTTQVGTSAEGIPQASTVNSKNLFSANLILIQKNLTWSEALSYCRQHHFDLVYVSSKDIQDKVAQKATNSTSSYVWLGLRYSCNFHFWFWVGPTSGCYQNWVQGEGPDGVYGCGVGGAIQATRGHQWVGLPETEELNFICIT